MDMLARRTSNIQIGTGTDDVIFGISLPGDSVVKSIRANVSILNPTLQAVAIAYFYMGEGYILPVLDPDQGGTIDAHFDRLVPKDIDPTELDLDTGSADGSNFSEPGEMEFAGLVDVGFQPHRIWSRRKMLTSAASGNVMYESSLKWFVSDSFSINIKRNFRVSQPSVLAFAIGSPAMSDTTLTREYTLLEAEWSQVKYMEMVLERALLDLLGVADSGTDSPWEEAIVLLQKHLEPASVEDTGGLLGASPYEVYTDASILMSVPGTMGQVDLYTR